MLRTIPSCRLRSTLQNKTILIAMNCRGIGFLPTRRQLALIWTASEDPTKRVLKSSTRADQFFLSPLKRLSCFVCFLDSRQNCRADAAWGGTFVGKAEAAREITIVAWQSGLSSEVTGFELDGASKNILPLHRAASQDGWTITESSEPQSSMSVSIFLWQSHRSYVILMWHDHRSVEWANPSSICCKALWI
jgi:hypothetical protein